MIQGLIGKKIGMTQIFEDNGTVTPVTVIEAGPCVVVQCRTPERDGYSAVQIGLVDAKSAKRANKPTRGHHAKADVPPTRLQREFGFDEGTELKPGDPVAVGIFEGVSSVDILGATKGRGFQGVIKRHGFGGGKASHGSMHHRAPGSIGMAAYPARVLKGMRGPGQMGTNRVTQKNMTVVRVDSEKNLLIVKGSVPGSKGSMLMIRRSQGVPAPSGAEAKDA